MNLVIRLPRARGFLTIGLALLLVPSGCRRGTEREREAGGMPPVAVVVADVVGKDMPVEIATFGTVEPSESVAVRAQTGGMLTKVHFREGQEVKGGDPLFSIDPRPAEAALRQAEANLSRDVVQQKNAAAEADRQEELFKKGLVPQDIRDQARTVADALAAGIKADQAAVESARLALAYCSIAAPIGGRTSRLTADAGNVVKANDQVLVTINRIKPIYVGFSVTQSYLAAIRRRMAADSVPVRVRIPDDPAAPETGALAFVDNAVSKDTGTIRILGTLSNEQERLWPGQFVNVTVELDVQRNATVVPSAALQNSQKGQYVFVVKPDMTAEMRFIGTDRASGGEVVVASGLTTGELVVVDGQFRVRTGSRLNVKGAAGKPSAGRP